jgi:choline dehydrogenase
MSPDPLAEADVCVVGAGAAGCVLAARLSEDGGRRVCLVEAGPDYGHLDEGRWPEELLDASDCATMHDWGHAVDQVCRVVGGSSAHNGCLVVWGTPADYDEWAAATGDPGWGWTTMGPRLRRAEAKIESRAFADDEVGGWTRRALAGWAALGSQRLEAFNAPASVAGHGLLPVNRRGRLRVGAAFAYLDPARGRPNLTVVADALADRVLVERGAARGVVVRRDGRESLVAAPLVVLAAGAYGSPPVLLRTGIGPADELRSLGIDVGADVPAVGRGLHDHPCVSVGFAMDPAFAAELAEDDACGALTHVQSKLKAASSHCPAGTFDLHLLPNVGWQRDAGGVRTGGHEVSLIPVLLKPRARGTVRLRSADPEVLPEIDRNLFADPDGHDLAVLVEGVALARALAASGPVAPALAGESAPGAGTEGPALEAWIRESAFALYHPTGTCRLGRPGDPDAVADADGRVRGIDGLHVADASALPTVPRANTHLSVLAFADAMADRLAAVS